MSKHSKLDIQVMMIDDATKRIEAIREFIKDQSNSLEDRLDIFLDTPEHLRSHHQWVLDFYSLDEKGYNWMDDHYVEKYQKVDLVDFVKEIRSGGRLSDWSEEEKNTLYEQIVNSGFHSFTYDW